MLILGTGAKPEVFEASDPDADGSAAVLWLCQPSRFQSAVPPSTEAQQVLILLESMKLPTRFTH